jgi:hypothetical protein
MMFNESLYLGQKFLREGVTRHVAEWEDGISMPFVVKKEYTFW